jgi:DtxR family Mn-dependent transcriptional regulator
VDDSLVLSPALQDYLEAIWRLVSEKGDAHAGEIAQALSVHKSTVTAALKKLSNEKLVEYSPYYAVTLTAQGREVGREVARRHKVLSRFMTEVLLVESGMADRNACRMEHVLDREVLRRLRLFGEFVKTCPRTGEGWLEKFEQYVESNGEMVPDQSNLEGWMDGLKERLNRDGPKGGRVDTASTLNELKPGDRARVVGYALGAKEYRDRLLAMGLTKGTEFTVTRVAPLGDPVEVNLRGFNLSLRKGEAGSLKVEKL